MTRTPPSGRPGSTCSTASARPCIRSPISPVSKGRHFLPRTLSQVSHPSEEVSMKTVYTFGGGAVHDDPRAKDKTVTGGKGANLAEMAAIGLPVPPGFTITTEECVRYLKKGANFSDELRGEVAKALKHIENAVGKRFGDAGDPLLVSVRSGA